MSNQCQTPITPLALRVGREVRAIVQGLANGEHGIAVQGSTGDSTTIASSSFHTQTNG